VQELPGPWEGSVESAWKESAWRLEDLVSEFRVDKMDINATVSFTGPQCFLS